MIALRKNTVDNSSSIEFLQNKQNEDGSYLGLIPHPVASMCLLGTLYGINSKPKYKETRKWVLSLQTGHRGFGETTGENSWDYTTYWGSQMHKSLGLKPKFEKDFIRFINSHQNKDGGFGFMPGAKSRLRSTLHWSKSLHNFNYKLEHLESLSEYLKNELTEFVHLDYWSVYTILSLLNDFCDNQDNNARMIDFFLNNYVNSMNFEINLESLFYSSVILSELDADVKHITRFYEDTIRVFENQNEDGGFGPTILSKSEHESTYFATKLLNLFEIPINKKNLKRYVDDHEIHEGGYYDKTDCSAFMAYTCIYGLNLLKEKPRYSERSVLWFKNCQNQEGGFGFSPKGMSNEKATFWSAYSLKLLAGLDKINKSNLSSYLNRNMNNTNPYNLYYTFCTYDLLDDIPTNYEPAIDNLLKFQNNDGGFGSIINTISQMYEVYRSVSAICALESILDRKGIAHKNWLSHIKEGVIMWIKSCSDKNGGCSWVPKDVPYIQPTHHAIVTLDLLGENIENKMTHMRWIKKFKNKDGGFNGGEDGTPSDCHFSFWALKALSILDRQM